MKQIICKTGLMALALFLATGVVNARVDASEPAGKRVKTGKAIDPAKLAKAKAAAAKLVDINSASKAELKTLIGIDDARAEKIIKGRPYLSKAFLVSNNIVPAGEYLTIKDKIIARQK